jgi:hypothetical protein
MEKNPIYDFYIPGKRGCFWVRGAMQTGELKHRKKQNRKSYIYPAADTETAENALLQ